MAPLQPAQIRSLADAGLMPVPSSKRSYANRVVRLNERIAVAVF